MILQQPSPALLYNTLFPTLLDSTRLQHSNFVSRVFVAVHCKCSFTWSLDVFVLLRFAMYGLLLQMCCREVLQRRRELLEKGAVDLPWFRSTGMRLHQMLPLAHKKGILPHLERAKKRWIHCNCRKEMNNQRTVMSRKCCTRHLTRTSGLA